MERSLYFCRRLGFVMGVLLIVSAFGHQCATPLIVPRRVTLLAFVTMQAKLPIQNYSSNAEPGTRIPCMFPLIRDEN